MPTNDNQRATLIDYSESTRYQVQPFFKAGDYHTVKWIHRKTGKTYSSAALLEQKDKDITGADNQYVVSGSTTSGIAGSTFYQMQAQLIKP